ncbi:MAG: ATP-dependent Clp protease adaptor ClpS [Verrucomicrobiales bacterium]|nr:ATP-dependent Clp protease adaptor ClpS [Verrucomicrobiales bacterium]
MPLELPELKEDTSTSANGLWQVVLLDDDAHTYDYVIEMLMEIFHHPIDLAYRMACDVDNDKRVIVDVDTKKTATSKCRKIQDFGPDWRIKRSRGSMRAVIEPVE